MGVDGTSGPLTADVAGEGHTHPTAGRPGVEGPGEGDNSLIGGIGVGRDPRALHSGSRRPPASSRRAQNQAHGRILTTRHDSHVKRQTLSMTPTSEEEKKRSGVGRITLGKGERGERARLPRKGTRLALWDTESTSASFSLPEEQQRKGRFRSQIESKTEKRRRREELLLEAIGRWDWRRRVTDGIQEDEEEGRRKELLLEAIGTSDWRRGAILLGEKKERWEGDEGIAADAATDSIWDRAECEMVSLWAVKRWRCGKRTNKRVKGYNFAWWRSAFGV
ncbi:hypothetical protein B296_00037737 [Ensete ventricosum]|uniref:Uncharacterized protein n=1 Tax=Ensete ventricosum TaxID=4639 RepID=A0A426YNX6_ENSVE|nr:hypothetical protein B296_00037737 [Ensete ventricosum]